ncbi:MAG: T9SS type A sorting domain-containing protein [Bacteroidota bacterium]
MKLSPESEKKLARYCSFAVTAVTASQASAQISYTDLTPDIVISDSSIYFDMDGDSVNDFFFIDTNYTAYNVWIAAVSPMDNSRAFAGNIAGAYEYPFKLTLGTVIDDGLIWVPQNGSNVFGSLAFNQSSGFPFSGSFWENDATDGYLALKINISTFDYFGWVRLSVAANTQSLTIRDYAIQQSPNTAIPAGQTTVGINENNQPAAGISWIMNQLHIQLYQTGDASVTIFDISGKIVQNFNISSSGKFDMTALTSGVYIAEITGQGFQHRQRFVITR